MGTRNFIFIGDFKSLKEAFTSPQSTNRPFLFSFDAFSNYKRLGFVNNTGQSIQNLRRFTLTHLRNAGMGKSSMENIIRYELECLIKEFKKDEGKPVEIPYSLNVAIINILWKVLADVRFDVSDKKIQEFEKLIADLFIHAQHPLMFIFDQYPILPKLIPHFIQAKLGLAPLFNIWDQLIDFLKKAIDDHLSSLDEENPRDFIDAFLIQMKAKENGKENEKNFNFTYEELLYCLSDMFSAGSETTASTFRWTILYLTKYPEVQKKVHEEIDKALPRDRLPTLLDKDKLVYTQAVINEALRLNPIAMFGLQHTFDEEFEIKGYCIPKDAIVMPSIIMCHHDPDYWEDPKVFKPERFITPEGKLDINKEGFLPFSIGRRNCIGETLARTELFFFVVGILQNFKFEAPEDVEISTEPDKNRPFFLTPNPFKIIMTVRD
ncbi:Cytochrome P450 2L1 [Armadillidium nasatum]|uniref:Cytochrome P450 2L1 n=1 Tax=Armadillidium nasatum TaxID=96803 RepID=A0A5N5TKD5_9CRUS|nr:Cytochrome P450 2L1 [Armadillidium nasatum]